MKSVENLSFETAMDELSAVVSELESGDLDLVKSLEKYERGIGLARYCQQALQDAQSKIQMLGDGADQTCQD